MIMRETLSESMSVTVQGVCEMMNGIWSRHVGLIAVVSGLIGATIYLLMISVTLAHIEAVSGQIPFDMRPFGYGPAEAVALLDALGAEGRDYYLSHQVPLDTLYPAMLALTLIATMSWSGRRLPNNNLIRLGIVISVGVALFDYGENLGIMGMIWCWPDLPAPLVHAASAASIAKSLLTTMAVLLALLILFVRARQSKADSRP